MIRLCINTQTPPIRPLPGAGDRSPRRWRLGTDYAPNVGGIVPMMRALLRASVGDFVARSPRWIALGSEDLPEEVVTDEGYILETYRLDEATRAAYGRFKDSVWKSFHTPIAYRFSMPDYREFVEYSYRTADRLLRRATDYDLFYINDFQQLLVGGLVGSAAPALFRWHIPVDLKGYPEPVRRFFLKAMEGYDGIVVSTRSGLEELIRAGFHGRAFQQYPYLDPEEEGIASPVAVAAFREKHGLGPDHPIVLSVSRFDPVKRQDLLLDAFATVRRKHPGARLVLVGGGSFSTRTLTGEGRRSKADAWNERLAERVRARKLEGSVVFAGTLSDEELQAAYTAAHVFVHPAPWEGFGLVVIEAWCHNLPVVVSTGAGVAELVEDEVNGYSVPPGSTSWIARRIVHLLDAPESARRMGEVGALTARRCFVRRALPRLREIFERTIQLYEYSGLRARS
jgi:glycosyltransferase involved in cell wall biosynthesis